MFVVWLVKSFSMPMYSLFASSKASLDASPGSFTNRMCFWTIDLEILAKEIRMTHFHAVFHPPQGMVKLKNHKDKVFES